MSESTDTTATYKVYIIDYWVPFPSSEYGGVVIVTATSIEDAIDVLKRHSWMHGTDYEKEMIEEVKNAKCYEIVGEHKSEIIKEFLT